MKKYDLLILGTGPAGLTAAIYAARYKMNFLTVGKLAGGVVTEAHKVENYPGLLGMTGAEMSEVFKKHAVDLGAEIVTDEVRAIKKDGEYFEAVGNNGKWEAKKILIALGTERRKLSIPGEKEFAGKGVSYCATCDAFFYRKKTVAVVGGGDSAATAALYLGDLAEKVYLVYRGKELSAEPAWIEELNKKENIEIILNANPKEIIGENVVKNLELDNGRTLELNGVFIEVGSTPASHIIDSLGVKSDASGYIEVDESQKTNVDGIYAAGDITTNSFKLKQIITAAAEGAVSANAIYKELKKG